MKCISAVGHTFPDTILSCGWNVMVRNKARETSKYNVRVPCSSDNSAVGRIDGK